MTEFQIRKITGPFLVRDLFDIHAPGLEIGKKWPELSKLDEAERAGVLNGMLRDLSKTSLRQRDRLYMHLGMIDAIGSDARQTEAIEKMIIHEQALNERYAWAEFGFDKSKKHKRELSRTPHNLAAWIDIVAHTPESSKRYPAAAIAGAKRIYDRLVRQAASIAAEIGCCTFFLTPATANTGAEPKEIAALFESAYRKYRTKITGIENYPATVSPSVRTGYIRYSVNMAANPNISVQVHDGAFLPAPNPNADNFRLDYHPVGDYVRISRVVDRDTSREIVALFAETMGCTVQDFRKKRCSLAHFDNARPPALTLPAEALSHGDRAWISSIESAYLDANGNIISQNREINFPYDDKMTIYENLRPVGGMNAADTSRVGLLADKRVTTAVWISFELHDFTEAGGGRKMFHQNPMKPVVVKVSTSRNDYLQKVKDLKPYHKDLILGVLKSCDTLPKNRDEFNEIQES